MFGLIKRWLTPRAKIRIENNGLIYEFEDRMSIKNMGDIYLNLTEFSTKNIARWHRYMKMYEEQQIKELDDSCDGTCEGGCGSKVDDRLYG